MINKSENEIVFAIRIKELQQEALTISGGI